MIDASLEFHQAIRGLNPKERFMFVFDGDVTGDSEATMFNALMLWTDADIVSDCGVTVVEAVCGGSELEIGQTMSSTLRMKVFNERGYLNDFVQSLGEYGTGKAYLGVKLEDYTVPATPTGANCVAYIDGLTITGHNVSPYVRINGEGIDLDYTRMGIAYPVGALIVEKPQYAQGQLTITAIPFNPNGDAQIEPYIIYREGGTTWGDLSSRTWGSLASSKWEDLFGTVEDVDFPYFVPYMNNYKYPQIAASKRGFAIEPDGILREFNADGTASKWEYQPLGRFRVDTPRIQNNVVAEINAYDRMTLFDRPVAEWLRGLTFPMTIGTLYNELCLYCAVWNTGSTFLNSTVVIPEVPKVQDSLTGRALLGYIAEAAGGFARMTRNGKVEIVRLGTTTLSVHENDVFQTQIADYTCAPIDKVTLSVPRDGQENMIVPCGDGDNLYQLSDNFLLYNDDFYTVQGRIFPIYLYLYAQGIGLVGSPAEVLCISDWAFQAGDYYNYNYLDAAGVQQTKRLLCMKQTIEYHGIATAFYESHGEPKRPARLVGSNALSNANGIARLDSALNAQNRAIQQLSRRSAVSNMGLCVCVTEANIAAKTIDTADGNATYTAGTMLTVQFKQGNTAADPTLQIDTSPAVPLVNGHTGVAPTATEIHVGMYALLVYNGEAWIILNPTY